jgi:hypothetical protein
MYRDLSDHKIVVKDVTSNIAETKPTLSHSILRASSEKHDNHVRESLTSKKVKSALKIFRCVETKDNGDLEM